MTRSSARERILDAVVSLHEEVGPAATTISAVAERAGVQRLTVYRHFPDERALIHGCSAHWRQAHPPPDPTTWTGIENPGERLVVALGALYSYFEEGRPMLTHVLRDEDRVAPLREVMGSFWTWLAETAGSLSAGWGVTEERQRLVRAAVGHAVRFESWRSLSDEGLSNEEAVRLMGQFVARIAEIGDGTPGR